MPVKYFKEGQNRMQLWQ